MWPRERLLGILLTESTIRWVHYWLDHHDQRMVNHGSVSNWEQIFIGIPLASVLGWVLFNIFIKILRTWRIKLSAHLVHFPNDIELGGIADALKNKIGIPANNQLEKWSELN